MGMFFGIRAIFENKSFQRLRKKKMSNSNKVMIFGCQCFFAKFREKNRGSNPNITNRTECCRCKKEHTQTLVVTGKDGTKQFLQDSKYSHGSRKRKKCYCGYNSNPKYVCSFC